MDNGLPFRCGFGAEAHGLDERLSCIDAMYSVRQTRAWVNA